MKNRIVMTLCAVILSSGAVSASPLTNYSAGKAVIDLNYSQGKLDNSGGKTATRTARISAIGI